MKFETPDGCLFTLTIERYEFPDEELGPTEDNPAEDFETGRFLIVSHTFRNADGEWEASGPTMTTAELQQFIDWLDSIRHGLPTTDGVDFTEYDLEFTVDASTTFLRVHTFWDFLPAWVKPEESVIIEFAIRHLDLDAVIDSLEQQLAEFPG